MAKRTRRADRKKASPPAARPSAMVEPLEPRLLLSASLPGLHLVDPTVDRFDGQAIYLDFNGAQGVDYNGPVTVENIDVPAFAAPGSLAGQEHTIIAEVLARLSETFASTGLVFSTERPSEGSSFSTVYVGGTDSAFPDLGDAVGIAETVDVGNRLADDNAFVFSDNLTSPAWVDALATAIAHETGHLLGYAHDEGSSTPLEELLAVSPDSTRTFTHPAEDNGVRYITLAPDTYTFRIDAEPNGSHNYQWYSTYSGTSGLQEEGWLYYYDDHNFTFSAGNSYWVRAEVYDGNWNWEAAYRWNVTCASTASLQLSTSSLSLGSSSTSSSFSVRNSGGGTLSYSVSDNRSWLSVSPTSGSSTGEWDTINVNVNRSGLSAGDYSGSVTVDPSTGSDQTVNVYMSVPQSTAADISVSSISTVVAGETVTVNYTVTNTSNYSRSFGVGGEIWQSSTKKADLGTRTTSTLSPGGTYSGSFSYTTGTTWGGTYAARCAVWTGTPGSSTHLDTYDRNFSVAAQSTDADISVSSISTVVAGETVTVNYTVTNTSNYSRSFGVGGEIWQSSTKKADLGTRTTSTLSPGGTYSGSFSYTTGTTWSGTYTARCAVWTGTPGSSTHLDSYDRNFSVAARLTDAGISISAINTVVAGDVVTVNYTVTNTGNFARSFGVGGEIWQGTTKKVDLGTTSTATLAANGGTWSGTFTYSTPGSWGGSYFARCAVWDGVPGVGTQLDTEDRDFSVTPQSIPDITSGRVAWHSYTAYDDDGTGYRPLDGTIQVYDFGTASRYTRAEATIAADVVHAMNPNFSADGRYLTFMGLSASRTYSHTDDSWANWLDVYVYDFRTDTLANVSAAAGRAAYGQVDEDPVFSPDGGEIVFKKDRSDLWVINTSDYTLRQLTAGPGEESGPQFSPDGSWVVFWVGDGANAHIAKVAASSAAATSYISVIDNDPVSFAGDTGVQDYFPSYWDESRIIYTSWDTSKLPGENDDDDIRIRDIVSGADYFAGFNSGYPVDDSDAFSISSSLLGFSTRAGWWDLWYGSPVSGASRSLGIGIASKHNLGGEFTQLVVPYVPNQAPTEIALSNSSVPENQPSGTVVGNLSTTDPDAGDTFVYNLVTGTGSTDNALFIISGNQLKTAASFNYESKNSYSIRVRTTDQGGTGLSYEDVFTISVTNVNEQPTNIALSNSSVPENQPSGAVVGNLSTTDPDAGDTFAYSLVSGTGSTDNSSFTISGNQIKAAASFNYEAKNSYSIRVRTTDQGGTGLSYEKLFTISVTDELDAQVAGQYVFFNNSPADGNTPGASSQDDNAIAGAQALMPGDTGSGANCTAYSKGLNGIMVDIDGLADPSGLSLATIGDYFGFKVGTSGDPSGWASAPTPTAVDVRSVGGNSRVTIIWADNAIEKKWLQVTVKAGAATGLSSDDVFYFGNMPGDATGDGVTNGFDLLRVRQNYLMPPGGGRDDTADVTMDGNVNGFDLLAVRQNYLQSLPMISTPAAPTGGMAMTSASFEEALEPLSIQPVPTVQLAPVVEQMQVAAVPTPAGTAAAITASFNRTVSVAPAALEIVNPVGRKVELPAFRYEPVTRTAKWTTAGLSDGLYQGVIRSSGVLSDGVSMARDSQFRFRLTGGIITDLQEDTNGDGIINLLDLLVV